MALNNQEDFISILNATGHSTVEMIKYYDTRDTLKNNAVHGMAKLIQSETMSDNRTDEKLNLEEILKASKPEDFKLTEEDREWLNSTVGNEALDIEESEQEKPKRQEPI